MCYNLGTCSSSVVLQPTKSNSYNGEVDTQGEWIKVTLDISSLKPNSKPGQDLFALKVGEDANYDLLVDEITIE